ncbi:aldehyde dehydrogenase family protein, partial [Halolamina litorea]
MTEYANFIGGEWVDAEGGETFETYNPAAPDEAVATYPESGVSETDAAVAAA